MNLIFDFVTHLYLIAVGAFLIELTLSLKQWRHKSLGVFLLCVFGFSWIVIFYGSFIEPRMMVQEELLIEFSEDGEDIKAVVLADWHLGPYKKEQWVQKVVDEVNALEPDLVLMLGDYIYGTPSQVDYLSPIAELEAPLGVYAVTGNHDYHGNHIEYVIESLERFNVRVLQNESATVGIGQEKLVLAGMDDLWNRGSALLALKGTIEEDNVILLAHNPDVVMSIDPNRADWVFSGHTHGGQIRLPFIGSVSELPTVLNRPYDQGVKQYGEQNLFITSGIGESGPRARLFCPPEIVVVDIKL